jgi:hypothetical protein
MVAGTLAPELVEEFVGFETLHSAKQFLCRVFFFAGCFYLALSKELLCRVPKKHSIKNCISVVIGGLRQYQQRREPTLRGR